MNKKPLIIFSLFFAFVLVSSLFFVNNVSADSFYNWIQNPSFVKYTDYIEYGGFENNAWDDGDVYGNWSIYSSTPLFSLNKPHTGQYSIWLYGAGEGMQYNFTDAYEVLGSEIIIASLFFYQASNDDLDIKIYYTDATFSDYSSESYAQDVWTYLDFTSYFTISKTVDYIVIYTSGDTLYVDDVVFFVDDGEGQDSLTGASTPWYGRILVILPDGIELVDNFGRLDNYSCEFTENALGFDNWIAQDVNYLETEYVHFVNLYYYTVDSTNMSIIITLFYQDGSSSSREKDLDVDSSWIELNFGSSFISESKQIVDIEILVDGVESGDILYIDDIGLWASVSVDYTMFEFTVTPSADVKSSSGCFIRTGVTYLFNFYLYNSTMGLSYNGTFALVDATGYTNGTMILGTFDYMVTPRLYIAEYTYEYFAITITTTDTVYSYSILVVFKNIEGGVPDDGITDIDADFMTNWVVIAIVLLMPSLMFASIGASISPSMGIISFIGGLTIMGGISLTIHLINVWFMFAIIIVDILLIVGMLKGGSNSG